MGEGVDLRLLGDLSVNVNGSPVDGLRSGRARSLLAYLVLQPDVAHARQRLASTFWPDSSEAQSRTNLRNVLHTLRRVHPAIDDAVDVTVTTLQWCPESPVVVDVERFVSAVDAAVEADPDEVDALIDRCRMALDEYGGDLLAGDQDEWLVAPRDGLRDRYHQTLRMLITALIDDGRGAEAVHPARDLVRSDPLDESAHRLRIEAHQSAGDRAGAVRAYHECATTLERELGVSPDPATMEVYEKLLGLTSESGSTPGRREVTVDHPLIGRSAELARLKDAWAAAGGPALVLVSGEAGIGKTRLVEELRSWCLATGAVVGEARSYEREGDLGLAVVVSWLRSPAVQAAAHPIAASQARELARLLPELGPEPAISDADEATRKRRLFDATVAALTASDRPTLLIADDAQWSDGGSHELIHYLLRQSFDHPLLVVLTARREDLDRSHPLVALRDSLALLDRVIEVPLDRLPAEDTGALGSQLLGAPLDEARTAALHTESEGNPLFVVEMVRAGWDGAHRQAGITPRLRAVIESRFRRLSDVGSSVLSAASVVGRSCSAALLGRISGLDDQSLALGLDELWQRGILREVGTDAYDFSHGKLRDAAYGSLAPAVRRTCHAQVADALVTLSDRDGPPASSIVAHHHLAANRVEEAVTWFQRAAEDAYRVHAYTDAMSSLDRALELVPSLPAGVRHRWELELLSTLPYVLAGIDGYGTERMSEAHSRAVDVAADLGVELRPAFVRSMVMSALCRDEFATATTMASRLGALAERSSDHSLLMESHYLRGIAAYWAADLDAARRHFETVVADFDSSSRQQHHVDFGHDPQVVCLSRLANTLWFLGEPDLARTTCEAAIALADDLGHPLSHDTAMVFACVLAVDLGDVEMLRSVAPGLGALGMNSAPHARKRDVVLALIDVVDGDHDDGIRRMRVAIESCGGRNFYPGFRTSLFRFLIEAHSLAPDPKTGLEACHEALELGGTPLWDAEFHRLRAEFHHHLGADRADVEAELDAAEDVARAQGAQGHLRRAFETRHRLTSA